MRGKSLPYAFLVPSVVVLGTMMGYPLVRMVLLAFQNMNNYRKFVNPSLVSYVGFDTFDSILTRPAVLAGDPPDAGLDGAERRA